jgi:hypothetical protein
VGRAREFSVVRSLNWADPLVCPQGLHSELRISPRSSPRVERLLREVQSAGDRVCLGMFAEYGARDCPALLCATRGGDYEIEASISYIAIASQSDVPQQMRVR